LRSIVLPLEEQIVALKGKLRETDSLLQEYEKRQVRMLIDTRGYKYTGRGKKEIMPPCLTR
jgi:hypothetical protein